MKQKPQSGVTRIRAHGEPERIKYDPDRHPGIIKRLLAFGTQRPDVAAILGVTDSTLAGWFAKYPELDEARMQVGMRGPDLLDVAYRAALGPYDPETGTYAGGDPGMMRFLLERKHGLTLPTKEERKASDAAPDDAAKLKQAVDRLVGSLGGAGRLREMVNAMEHAEDDPTRH